MCSLGETQIRHRNITIRANTSFSAPALSENSTGDRERRFGPMGGGAGGSPFHSPGGKTASVTPR